MSDFKMFMKGNKKKKENQKYAATKSLVDENGKPLEWELKHITSKENEDIRDECTTEVQVTGKFGMYRNKTNTAEYVRKLITASVVHPDLDNTELQNSYGVMCAEDLLMEMVDDPGEYADLAQYVQEMQGFKTLQEDVDEAKN
ncbi:MAG: hypothetical protein IJF03_10105 [Lachnospiraceae bacterium]|nr:hypothetical protein [Lachnospiraceae bacterium]